MDSTTQNHSFSSSSSYSTPILNYDVFLSFRGIDTRKNFTDHLYDALMTRSGIRTFKDDNELSKGETISSELIKAIEESRISVIVFSVNYASSRWCLDELVKIMDCKNTRGLLVVPVFYHIDPSDVRKQTGSYAEAFSKHEENYEMEKVQKWRYALSEVGSLSGWDLNSYLEGNESTFIKKIVKEVQLTLAQGNLLLLDKEEAKLKEKEQSNTENMKVVAVALEKRDEKMKDDLQKQMEVLKEEATNLSVERANLDIHRSLLLEDLTALFR